MPKRQIPCPYCSSEEKVLCEENGKTTRSASLWPKFQNIVFSVSQLIGVVTGNTTEVSRREVIGDCEACNNKRTFDDPSDSTDAEQAAFDILDSEKEYLETQLAKLGNSPGGSRLTRIAGADVLLVGHTINKAESVGIRDDAPITTRGGVGEQPKSRAGVMKGKKKGPAVKALNVPANSGGGQYVIQCGNKFNLVVGAQGAHIETFGPLNLHGKAGVQVTGAEVAIGSSTGQTAIGGKHIYIQGDYVTMAASGEDGHINVMGSIEATGNMKAGSAYADTLYFKKGTCPAKQTSVKGGSTTTVITGPTCWGGPNPNARRAAFLDLQKFVQERTLDPGLFKAGGPTTPRFQFGLNDKVYGLIYANLPFEPQKKQTGTCTGTCQVSIPNGTGGFNVVTGTIEGFVYNYPHTHSTHDGLHDHRVDVPALDYEGFSDANEIATAYNAAGGNTKVPAAGSTGQNALVQAYTAVTGVINAFAGKSAAEADHSTLNA